jgi:hypothetical protein
MQCPVGLKLSVEDIEMNMRLALDIFLEKRTIMQYIIIKMADILFIEKRRRFNCVVWQFGVQSLYLVLS